jgi:hypothetical protein
VGNAENRCNLKVINVKIGCNLIFESGGRMAETDAKMSSEISYEMSTEKATHGQDLEKVAQSV